MSLEIKSAKTLKLSLSRNIDSFEKVRKGNTTMGYIVYGGDENFNNFISWQKIDFLIDSIEDFV